MLIVRMEKDLLGEKEVPLMLTMVFKQSEPKKTFPSLDIHPTTLIKALAMVKASAQTNLELGLLIKNR